MFPTREGKWRNRREIGWKSGGEEPSGERTRTYSTDTGLATLECNWHIEGLLLSLLCVVDEIISSCPPLNLRCNPHYSPVLSELKVLCAGDAVKCWVTSEESGGKTGSLKGLNVFRLRLDSDAWCLLFPFTWLRRSSRYGYRIETDEQNSRWMVSWRTGINLWAALSTAVCMQVCLPFVILVRCTYVFHT